jgi:hypothetical protein
MAYENAAVLPLALSTAACGLSQKDQLVSRWRTPSPAAVVSLLLLLSTQPIEHLAQLLLGIAGQLFKNDVHDRG